MLPTATDTIAAPATAAAAAAIAVVRISGPDAAAIAGRVTNRALHPRCAEFCTFSASDGSEIDRGLALYFPSPHSYTGEDVIELHCHGSTVVVDWLLETLYALGARAAQPGEFTLRAYLHDKLDLAQAEAVADLIDSGTRLAARAALRSLSGEFSGRVATLQESLTGLRVLCEAWLDFPDEEIDRGALTELQRRSTELLEQAAALEAEAARGVILHDGLDVAIAGSPNAGKSSLLNRLAGYDAAIVTPLPGTTRDTIRERISLGGLVVNVVDTAGLRATADPIEIEGVRRAQKAVEVADHVLWVADIQAGLPAALDDARLALPAGMPFTLVLNKVDLREGVGRAYECGDVAVVELSALTGAGLAELTSRLRSAAGWTESDAGTFTARRRHLDALARARTHMRRADAELAARLELAAEEFRGAQAALSELTGELTSDDLLGEIFSSFCIGK